MENTLNSHTEFKTGYDTPPPPIFTYVTFAVIMNSLENPNLKCAVYC